MLEMCNKRQFALVSIMLQVFIGKYETLLYFTTDSNNKNCNVYSLEDNLSFSCHVLRRKPTVYLSFCHEIAFPVRS